MVSSPSLIPKKNWCFQGVHVLISNYSTGLYFYAGCHVKHVSLEDVLVEITTCTKYYIPPKIGRNDIMHQEVEDPYNMHATKIDEE